MRLHGLSLALLLALGSQSSLADDFAIITNWPCNQTLAIDRAVIHFNSAPGGISLYAVNHECYQCSRTLLFHGTSEEKCANLWTPFAWDIFASNGATLLNYKFNEHGGYNVTLQGDVLSVTVLAQPDNPNTPIKILLGILAGLTLLSFAHAYISRLYAEQSAESERGVSKSAISEPLLSAEQSINIDLPATIALPKKHPRLDCLDTFRGCCLGLMIFVNYGGGHYWFLEHSAWNGLTFADLLFPWFIWIMGVSMALSTGGIYQGPQNDNLLQWYRVARRACILFALGLFLGNGYNVTASAHRWRVPGVLQYFGISYFLVSATILAVRHKTRELLVIASSGESDSGGKAKSRFQWFMNLTFSPVLGSYRYEMMIQLSIFLLYVFVCLFVPAPGCPPGYNGPGGNSENRAHFDCTGGIHRFLDETILGYQRYYHHPTCHQLYECLEYDPEGLLGSLSATTLTYLGLLTGRVLLHFKDPLERIWRFSIWGSVLCLFAGALCSFSKNGGVIPINKNLWSASFSTLLAGLAMFALSLIYYVVDVWKLWTGAPYRFLGLNSILIYCAHGVFAAYFPFSHYIETPTHSSVLTMNVIGVCCWVFIAYYCYQIKFFVKV